VGVVLVPDLRQFLVSVYLPWDLRELDCFSMLELVVEPVGRCGAEGDADRG